MSYPDHEFLYISSSYLEKCLSEHSIESPRKQGNIKVEMVPQLFHKELAFGLDVKLKLKDSPVHDLRMLASRDSVS